MMAVGIVEVRGPQRTGDIARLLGEFHTAGGQRLMRGPDIFDRENHLDSTGQLAASSPAERFAQAKCDAAAIQKSETFILALEYQPQLVTIERHRLRHLLHAEHHDSDLRQLEIQLCHCPPPACYCTHAGERFSRVWTEDKPRQARCRVPESLASWVPPHGARCRDTSGAE